MTSCLRAPPNPKHFVHKRPNQFNLQAKSKHRAFATNPSPFPVCCCKLQQGAHGHRSKLHGPSWSPCCNPLARDDPDAQEQRVSAGLGYCDANEVSSLCRCPLDRQTTSTGQATDCRIRSIHKPFLCLSGQLFVVLIRTSTLPAAPSSHQTWQFLPMAAPLR